eukprot:5278911-Amphidinium_carterae.1
MDSDTTDDEGQWAFKKDLPLWVDDAPDAASAIVISDVNIAVTNVRSLPLRAERPTSFAIALEVGCSTERPHAKTGRRAAET